MIHPLSDVQTKEIGERTRIWQYSVILNGACIGNDCNICANVFVEADVKIGNNVTIKNQVQLWDGITINDDVFIGPNVTFCNDKLPRSKSKTFIPQKTIIHQGASIGAGSVILPNISIGKYAMIGAGSVLTKSVGEFELWYGNPACFQGYICACGTLMYDKKMCGKCSND